MLKRLFTFLFGKAVKSSEEPSSPVDDGSTNTSPASDTDVEKSHILTSDPTKITTMDKIYSVVNDRLYFTLLRTFVDELNDDLYSRMIMNVDMDGYSRTSTTNIMSDRYHHEMSILFHSVSDVTEVDGIYHRSYEFNCCLTERDRLDKKDVRVMLVVKLHACDDAGIRFKRKETYLYTNIYTPDTYHRFILSSHIGMKAYAEKLIAETDEKMAKENKGDSQRVVVPFRKQ